MHGVSGWVTEAMQAPCLCSVGQKCAGRVQAVHHARCWCAVSAPAWGTALRYIAGARHCCVKETST